MCIKVLTLAILVTTVAVAQSVPPQVQIAPRDPQGNYVVRWTDQRGVRRELLFMPGNKISPRIHVVVRGAAASGYVYRYTIANEKAARHKIHSCAIELAMPAQIMSTPVAWEPLQPSRIAPRAGWYRTGFVNDVPEGIAAGASEAGFEISSSNLPGVTEFKCRGNVSSTVLPDDLPVEVERRLETLPVDEVVVIRAIGPILEKDQASTAVLVRRIVRSYRVAIAASRLPNAAALVRALDVMTERADGPAGELRTAVTAVSGLLTDSSDPWARQLAAGLRECLTYLLNRLTSPR
jgi:hypothetical protein